MKAYSSPEYVSEVDGEVLHLQNGLTKDGYHRVSTGGGKRETVHIHEAKKVFGILGIPWEEGFLVHHIDLDRSNVSASNLHVLGGQSFHRRYHSKLEGAMHNFLASRGLLDEFYSERPELKLDSLIDLLAGKPFNFDPTWLLTCDGFKEAE